MEIENKIANGMFFNLSEGILENQNQKTVDLKRQKKELEWHFIALKNGNTASLEFIYLNTKNAVFSVIYAILKDYQLSEDVMHDTYIKMSKNIMYYKPNTNPKAWIVTIAKNLAINVYNRRKRETSIDIDSSVYGEYKIDENGNGMELKKALSQLNETERQIVLLHCLGGFKHREIAKILDKPIGTVMWTYNNSLSKLKRIMGINE